MRHLTCDFPILIVRFLGEGEHAAHTEGVVSVLHLFTLFNAILYNRVVRLPCHAGICRVEAIDQTDDCRFSQR